MAKVDSDQVTIAVISNDISRIKDDVRDIKTKLEMDYVTRQEFDPVKKVVYGMVSLILTVVVGALVYLVVQKP